MSLALLKKTVQLYQAVKDPVVYQCLANMIFIGFFFICRRGEHAAGSDTCRPFRLDDVKLYMAQQLDPDTPVAMLQTASMVELHL